MSWAICIEQAGAVQRLITVLGSPGGGWSSSIDLVVLVVAVAGGGRSEAAQTLNVYAATSLTNVFPALNKRPRYSFGGSNTLQLQIERGRAG